MLLKTDPLHAKAKLREEVKHIAIAPNLTELRRLRESGICSAQDLHQRWLRGADLNRRPLGYESLSIVSS